MHFKLSPALNTLRQLLKYGVTGLISNGVGYLLYLIVTYFGAAPAPAMTLLYAVGAIIGFFVNRRVTFSYTGNLFGSGFRYILVHLTGYCINLGILVEFVDRLGYPHQLIQAAAIFVVAAFLFITFKLFVFRSSPE